MATVGPIPVPTLTDPANVPVDMSEMAWAVPWGAVGAGWVKALSGPALAGTEQVIADLAVASTLAHRRLFVTGFLTWWTAGKAAPQVDAFLNANGARLGDGAATRWKDETLTAATSVNGTMTLGALWVSVAASNVHFTLTAGSAPDGVMAGSNSWVAVYDIGPSQATP